MVDLVLVGAVLGLVGCRQVNPDFDGGRAMASETQGESGASSGESSGESGASESAEEGSTGESAGMTTSGTGEEGSTGESTEEGSTGESTEEGSTSESTEEGSSSEEETGPLDEGVLDEGPLDEGPLDEGLPLDEGMVECIPLQANGCQQCAAAECCDEAYELCSEPNECLCFFGCVAEGWDPVDCVDDCVVDLDEAAAISLGLCVFDYCSMECS